MENNQVEKSQAELYREERKKRMAAVAKKSAKKNPKAAKAKKVVGKTVGIVLVIAIVLGMAYGILNFFGVPQKVLTAATIGDEKVSVAKYNYYYMDLFLNIRSTASQYDSYYGSGAGLMYTGFDSSKAPADQEYTLGELEGFEGENPTWADYLRINTLNYLQSYLAYAKLAREAGLTLTDEELAQIDEEIESLRSTAESNDYSLNRFLTKNFGKGVNEKLLREISEEKMLASKYATQTEEDITASITTEQIEAEYNENIETYAVLSVSAFTVSADTSSLADDATDDEKAAAQTEAMAKAKAQADEYAAKVTDAASLLAQAQAYNSSATETSVQYNNLSVASLKTSFGDSVSDWALASDRVVGDVTVLETSSGYAVIYMSVLPHKDTTKPVDVRHILIKFPTDDSGNTVELTDDEKATYRAQADEIYNQYLENPTEDNFAALANEKSGDSGSNTNGGLYEEVNVGDMVTQFNDWCFDASRKPGDTGIVETKYGYHIMYYVGNDYEEAWVSTIKSTLATTALNDFNTDIEDGETYKIDEKTTIVKWAISQIESLIAKYYISYTSS